jgi:hypothetical protein
MTKKALRIIPDEANPKRLVNVASCSADAGADADEGCCACEVDGERQVFSSEEQALEFLLGSVVEKIGDDPTAKAEMADFLTMLLDTDPELKDEVLAGVAIRNAAGGE